MFNPTETISIGGATRSARPALPRIECRRGLPYFMTSEGAPWTPIGHNDAISWPELAGLFRRRDVQAVRAHLRWLKDSGVTCLRVMLEYAQGKHRFIERPAGHFVGNVVRFWDDLFALCEEIGLHLLLTPFDTFFTWRHWKHHPYNVINGGPTEDRRRLITCTATREAIKRRLEFATRRWGRSPALFAWDLWNEVHPAQGEDKPEACASFVSDVSRFLRALEERVHGRANLQTVSVFGPELLRSPSLVEPIFRSPDLDFATTHLYESGAIDDPADTVAPALTVGRLMRSAVQEASDLRPVLDSEHGPIHAFIDKHRVLPEAFDDEYFRHIQWAHLASGGAGGGMRWPNRHPHVLTAGMRRAQRGLSNFLPLIDWTRFERRNLNAEAGHAQGFAAFACGDRHQAVAWLLRTDIVRADGMLATNVVPRPAYLVLPGLVGGDYGVVLFDTRLGRECGLWEVTHPGGNLHIECPPIACDVAIAVSGRR
ncbi:hypothetical protein J7E62_14905 [Variovorax paradoxus]|nr:hypothetical protein [Variovorax paradoxus]